LTSSSYSLRILITKEMPLQGHFLKELFLNYNQTQINVKHKL